MFDALLLTQLMQCHLYSHQTYAHKIARFVNRSPHSYWEQLKDIAVREALVCTTYHYLESLNCQKIIKNIFRKKNFPNWSLFWRRNNYKLPIPSTSLKVKGPESREKVGQYIPTFVSFTFTFQLFYFSWRYKMGCELCWCSSQGSLFTPI